MKFKDTVVCIVGESGVGKTTVVDKLANSFEVIQSYTTRPPRIENEAGHQFVSLDYFNSLAEDQKSKMVSYTYYGGHHYWVLEEQLVGRGVVLFVVDKKGVKILREKQKEGLCINIIVIGLILSPDLVRDRLYTSLLQEYEGVKHSEEINKMVDARMGRQGLNPGVNVSPDITYINLSSDSTADKILKFINSNIPQVQRVLPVLGHGL